MATVTRLDVVSATAQMDAKYRTDRFTVAVYDFGRFVPVRNRQVWGTSMTSLDRLITLKYDWEHDYLVAILETDNEKLKDLVAKAKSTMLARVDQLDTDRGESAEERASLATALCGLRKLRIERLGTFAL